MVKNKKRKLFYVPTLHLSRCILEDMEDIYGKKFSNEYKKLASKYWDLIEKKIKNLKIDRIYAEGWRGSIEETDSQDESKIKKYVKERGKFNRQDKIIFSLLQRRVKIEKTESSELILVMDKIRDEAFKLEEMELEKGSNYEKRKLLHKLESFIRKERDEYIANRINETLLSGENGILFLGCEHKIKSKLSKGIEISYIINENKIKNIVKKSDEIFLSYYKS